jgi:hypothetical protein
MIIELSDYSQLEREVLKFKPKIVVLAGKHEPREPTADLIRTKVNGFSIDEYFSPKEVLFAIHPKSSTPAGYYQKVHDYLLKLADDMAEGRSRILGDKSEVFGKKLKAYLEYAHTVKSAPPEEFVKALNTYMVKNNIFANVMLNKHIKEKFPMPEEEPSIAEHIKKISPETEVLRLHYSPGNKEPAFDREGFIEFYTDAKLEVTQEQKEAFAAAYIVPYHYSQMGASYVCAMDKEGAKKANLENALRLRSYLEKRLGLTAKT